MRSEPQERERPIQPQRPRNADEAVKAALGEEVYKKLEKMGMLSVAKEAMKVTTAEQAKKFMEGPGTLSRIGSAIVGIPGAAFSSLGPSFIAALVVPAVGAGLRGINPNLHTPGTPTPLPDAQVAALQSHITDGSTVQGILGSPTTTEAFTRTALTVGGLSLGVQTGMKTLMKMFSSDPTEMQLRQELAAKFFPQLIGGRRQPAQVGRADAGRGRLGNLSAPAGPRNQPRGEPGAELEA